MPTEVHKAIVLPFSASQKVLNSEFLNRIWPRS